MNSLDLLKKLVACKSITPHSNGVIEILAMELETIGFNCELVTFPKGKEKTKEEDAINYSVKNLYARYGTKEPILAFCGHLDVVPSGNISFWESDPFTPTIKTIEGEDYIIGRGTEDMKGGVAAFTAAVSSFIKNETFAGSIVFLITLDEEDVSINGIYPLLEYISHKGIKLNDCIVGEASSVNQVGDFIKIGSRGSLVLNITVEGKQGHVAYPDKFINPITIISQLIVDLKNLKLDNGNEFFQPSNLEIVSVNTENGAFNVVPSKCIATGNIRYNTEHTVESLKGLIQSIVNEHTGASVEFNNYPSNAYCASSESKIYKCTAQAIRTLTNIQTKSDTTGGTSDARFILAYCEVIEFGLCRRTLHQANERIKIKDLYTVEAIYKQVLSNYFK